MKRYRWDAIIDRIDDTKPSTIAEIGVWKGQLSRRLLEALPLMTLIQVDRWKAYTDAENAAEGNTKMSRLGQDKFDYAENDLNSFAVYTRIGKNVLRIHKIDKKIGLVEFNLISNGSPTDVQLSYALNNLLNNLDSIEKRGVKNGRKRNKNSHRNNKH